MPRSALVAVALGIVLGSGCQAPRAVVTARDLARTPEQYDEQPVVLAGTVQNPRKRIPEVGDAYTEFLLTDGTTEVPVIAWGTEDVSPGDLVEVRGVFRARAGVAGEARRGMVEAKFVRVLRGALQPRGTPVGPP